MSTGLVLVSVFNVWFECTMYVLLSANRNFVDRALQRQSTTAQLVLNLPWCVNMENVLKKSVLFIE